MTCIKLVDSRVVELSLFAKMNDKLDSRLAWPKMLLYKWLAKAGSLSCSRQFLMWQLPVGLLQMV